MKQIVSKLMAGKHETPGQLQRETRELRRLETLIDSVFALVIVLIVFDLPEPDDAITFELADYIAFGLDSLVTALLGVIVMLVYWFQSNLLLGNLERTDGKHAVLSLLQVFFVLVYLLTVSLGMNFGNETPVLAAQSSAAAMMGFVAAAAWWYASRDRRLLTPAISDDEVSALRLRVLAEPLTAIVTLALAFVSATAWEIGWLVYPFIAGVLRRAGVGSTTNRSTN
jgi:uncharacterized membrane protein